MGSTISKQCKRLKSDLVRALQTLKCLHKDLLFWEQPSVQIELDENETESHADSRSEGWDILVVEDGKQSKNEDLKLLGANNNNVYVANI